MGVCELTLGSFFNGISGWILSAEKYGIKTIWESEVDDYCEAVTAHHYPDVKQLGDITKLKAEDLEPVDIICAGSPCQDLSVAGKREGLAGERSGLFVDAIKLVHGLRERTGKPRYFVWENVPGAFSSNKGHDFRAVLEEITKTEIPMPVNNKWAEAGYVEWGGTSSLAWRTLDAQYWGVPQRRKRIFLVADFGGFTAGEILFIEQGLHGDSSESKGTGEEAATNVGTSTNSASDGVIHVGFMPQMKAESMTPMVEKSPCLVNGTNPGWQNGVATVRMRSGCEGGGKGPLVSYDKSLTLATNNDQTVFCLDRASFNQGRNAQYNFKVSQEGIADTLVAKGPGAVAVLGDSNDKVCGDRESSAR